MREYFKDLPDETTPLSASRINGLLNGEESIEKIVVGDIECKNIFDEQWGTLGKRYTDSTSVKFATTTTSGQVGIANPIKLDRTKSYLIMSTNSSYTTNGIYFYDENGIFLTRVYLNFGKVITIPTDAYYMTFNLTDVTDISDLANYTWQVEYIDSETDTFTPYSKMKKYGYNSIDSMGSIVVDDIKCKNLFNKYGKLNEKIGYTTGDTTLLSDGTIKATSNYAAGNGPGPIIILKPNTDYIVSFDVISMETTGSCTFRAYGINEDGNIELIFDKYFSSTGHRYQTFNSGKHSKVWLVFNGIFNSDDTSARKYVIYDNVQIEEGTVATEYTSHKSLGYTSGSNENGSWIKYDDGTLIQRGTNLYPANSDSAVLTFPVTFIDQDYQINVIWWYQWYRIATTTYSEQKVGSIKIFGTFYLNETWQLQTENELTYQWIAIGRWK